MLVETLEHFRLSFRRRDRGFSGIHDMFALFVLQVIALRNEIQVARSERDTGHC